MSDALAGLSWFSIADVVPSLGWHETNPSAAFTESTVVESEAQTRQLQESSFRVTRGPCRLCKRNLQRGSQHVAAVPERAVQETGRLKVRRSVRICVPKRLQAPTSGNIGSTTGKIPPKRDNSHRFVCQNDGPPPWFGACRSWQKGAKRRQMPVDRVRPGGVAVSAPRTAPAGG